MSGTAAHGRSVASIGSSRVVLPSGTAAATVVIRDGRIAAIESYARGAQLDAGDLVVAPGLVDTHVHVNEPGRTEWEGFASATRAAAAGGVTTLIDMPLNSIPASVDARALEVKIRAATGQCHVDTGFWGGVVPGNAGELDALAAAGALGFKCFLSPSGVEEFGHVGEGDLRAALPAIARLGLPLLVHAELRQRLREPAGDPRAYRTWLASRPADAEHAAIELVIALAREYGARMHVVHLAAGTALPLLHAARRDGLRISVETCPHYLTFAAEEVAAGATAFKCAPPIRERAHRERLWQALADRDIDLIATDHSPAPGAMKHVADGDFLRAWGGIASLQIGLPAVWTGAAARGIPLERVIAAMSAAPAALAGLDSAKGAIAPGHDADFAVLDPDARFVVDAAGLHHRHPVTPYDAMTLRGRIVTTVLRGEVIFDRGVVPPPSGRCIRGRRSPAGRDTM